MIAAQTIALIEAIDRQVGLELLQPDGAGEAIVTVAVELLPPFTVVGFRRREVTAMPGVRVSVAC